MGEIDFSALPATLQVKFSNIDVCYVAYVQHSNRVGCGDTAGEAITHLINHLKDESETPIKRKVGRPKRNRVKMAVEVLEKTLLKIKELSAVFSLSQGDIIDKALSYYVKGLKSLGILTEEVEKIQTMYELLESGEETEKLTESEREVTYAKFFDSLRKLWEIPATEGQFVKYVDRDCYILALKLVDFIPHRFTGPDVDFKLNLSEAGEIEMVWILAEESNISVRAEIGDFLRYCWRVGVCEVSGRGKFSGDIPDGLSFCFSQATIGLKARDAGVLESRNMRDS